MALTTEQRNRMDALREKGFSNLTLEEKNELREFRKLIVEASDGGKAKVPTPKPVAKAGKKKKVVKEAEGDDADEDDEDEEEEEAEGEETEEVETPNGQDDEIVVPDEMETPEADVPEVQSTGDGGMVEIPAVTISTIKVPANLVPDLEKEGLTSEGATRIADSYKRCVAEHVNQIVKRMNRKTRLAVLENKIRNRRMVAERTKSVVDYHASRWAKENRVALEQGAKAMVLERFMVGMRDLFEECNVQVPRGKESLIDKMQREINTLNEKTSSLIKENMQIQKANRRLMVENQVATICSDLTDGQQTRVRKLALESRWTNAETLKTNIGEIKQTIVDADSKKSQKKVTLESKLADEALTSQPAKKEEKSQTTDGYQSPMGKFIADLQNGTK